MAEEKQQRPQGDSLKALMVLVAIALVLLAVGRHLQGHDVAVLSSVLVVWTGFTAALYVKR